jgi:Ni2+-binding GTPase involved in maturation of urease and hydrogenase
MSISGFCPSRIDLAPQVGANPLEVMKADIVRIRAKCAVVFTNLKSGLTKESDTLTR